MELHDRTMELGSVVPQLRLRDSLTMANVAGSWETWGWDETLFAGAAVTMSAAVYPMPSASTRSLPSYN